MYFQTEASKKFPEAKALASSILFLRFILPAVISPQKYRIWPGKFIPNNWNSGVNDTQRDLERRNLLLQWRAYYNRLLTCAMSSNPNVQIMRS